MEQAMEAGVAVSRRRFLATAAAFCAAPAIAQGRWSPLSERAARLDQLHSLTISERGRITFSTAFRGPATDRPVNVKSVSKTVVTTILGAATDRGAVTGPDQTLATVAPDLIPDDADPRVADITLGDLASLQAGLERTSGRNYGAWVSSPNWVSFALSRPMVREPGAGMLYSTGSTHVLGAALSIATGETLLTLARRWIGDPLDIEIPAWTRDPQGFYLGGNEMALSPLALIRLGEAFRQGGGDVVSRAWVEAAWTPRTRSPFSGFDYGYGWFLARAGSHPVRFARGYGGQMLYVIPDLELTVAITSDPTRPARSQGYAGDLNRLLAEEIVPVVEMA
ncbi:MAG: serine hydrolase domain-containing protein [Rubricella sp.]